MEYGKWLIDKAVKTCQSRYALAQRIGVDEDNLKKVYDGKRPLPLTWLPDLAPLASVDPSEALTKLRDERKKPKVSIDSIRIVSNGMVFAVTRLLRRTIPSTGQASPC